MHRPALRPVLRPRRALLGSAAALGLLLLGLACEPGIPTAPGEASMVRVSPHGAQVEVGDSVHITAAGLDASGTTVISSRRVRWTTSNAAARVDSLGWVFGIVPGTTLLRAEVDGHSDTTTVTILAPAVLRVDMTPDAATIILGQSRQLVAAAYGRRDTLLTGRPTSWSSSAPSIAEVSDQGIVTARGLGSAVITCVIEGHADTARVTVVPVPVKQLPVSPPTAQVQLGATLLLSAEPRDSTGAPLPGRVVAWNTANPAIATVDGGLVTGVAVGSTTVTATSEGIVTNVPVTVSVPVIVASRTTVAMTDRATGPNPAPELVSITNGGSFTLSGLGRTITYGAGQPTGWLAASFDQATAPATLTLQATTGSLAPGTYTATVTVTSTQQGVAAVPVQVSFTVVPQPQIGLSATAPSFGAQTSGANPAPQVVNVTNSGTGTLSGLSIATAYAGGQPTGWLTATLAGTTAPTTITLQPSVAGLTVGTYNATVTVSSTLPNVTTRVITVTFNVVAGPAIGLSATAVPFGATAFSVTPVNASIDVTNLGAGTLDGLAQSISYASGSGWLTANLASTVAPTTLSLQASAASLAAGTYTATVTVTSTVPGADPRTVTVTFTVGQQPVISLSAPSATFDVTRGTGLPSATMINITNGGGGTLSGLARSIAYGPGATGWLDATLSGTTAPATIALQPNTTSLSAGTYTATVTLSSTVPGVATVDLNVTLIIRQPQISLGSTSVALGSRTRGEAIASSNISVTNGGQGTLSGLSVSDDASWITSSLNVTTAPATLSIAYNTSGLTAGTYNGTVTVSSTLPGVTPQTVSVSVTVLQPQIGLSVTSASRTIVVGTNATAVSSTVSNSGSGTLSGLAVGSVTYSAGASGWVSASISSSTLPSTVTLTLNTSGIASAGTFTATVPVTSTVPGVVGQTITVTVTTQWSFATHVAPLLGSCTGCHAGLNQRVNLVGVVSTLAPCSTAGAIRVVMSNSGASILYRKLADAAPPCGGHMPNSTTFWPAADLQKLREWIDAGAPNN